MEDNFYAAETFIRDFIEADYNTWVANYTARGNKERQEIFDHYIRKFHNFQVVVLMGRPPLPSEEWFEESRKSLDVTFRRPLFKIDYYEIDGENIYVAYTGTTFEDPYYYYEIIVFKKIEGEYKIFSVYHTDDEGGTKHFQGGEFAFPRENYRDVKRFKAPDDDLDLQNYLLDPEPQA